MRVVLECPDEEGRIAFERTLSTILSESTVKGAIKYIRVLVDPMEPLFILIIRYTKPRGAVKFSEATTVREVKDGTLILCENDKYFPGLMRVLWKKFGRDRVEQLSRYEVRVEGKVSSDLLESTIYDPSEDFLKGLIDVIFRIIPEGFRIRKYMWHEDSVTVIASENQVREEFFERARDMLRGDEYVHSSTI